MRMKLIEKIATTLSVLGGILTISLNDSTRALGFEIWIISNFFWIYHGYKTKSWGIAITFTSYTIINIIGTLTNKHMISVWW